MEGFRKLGRIRNGESAEAEPVQSFAGMAAVLGGAAREKTFDNLPVHIQNWSRRCRGLEQ